ncbi:MAG: ABC transporter permease [Dehalococcoidia bacterium]|nr:ABC transporter permease [Dehalococcoidia bacterium]
MIPSNAVTIANRVVRQLVRDRRTIVLILAVPLVIMTLVRYSFPYESGVLDNAYSPLLATMGLFFSFLLTGISFLRERSQGTMERMMASPVSRLDMVIGYLLGFFVLALIQTLVVVLFTIYVLDANYAQGSLWRICIFQMVVVTVGVNLGIFVSAFARNEFQMVQFIPLIIFPQIFLCGVIWPVDQMSTVLQEISKFLPLRYAVDGMRDIMLKGQGLLDVGYEIGILAAFALVISILAALTLRRGAA